MSLRLSFGFSGGGTFVGGRLGDCLGGNVGYWGCDNSRMDGYRGRMFDSMLLRGQNVGIPEFSRVGNTYNYNGNNPYIATQVAIDKSMRRGYEQEMQREAVLASVGGAMPGAWYPGYNYGASYGGIYGNDRCLGGGSRVSISSMFNLGVNNVAFNANTGMFGRPSLYQQPTFDIGIRQPAFSLRAIV